MAQRRPIKFTQRLDNDQFNRLQNAAVTLSLSKSEVTRIALEKYLTALDESSHTSETPAALKTAGVSLIQQNLDRLKTML